MQDLCVMECAFIFFSQFHLHHVRECRFIIGSEMTLCYSEQHFWKWEISSPNAAFSTRYTPSRRTTGAATGANSSRATATSAASVNSKPRAFSWPRCERGRRRRNCAYKNWYRRQTLCEQKKREAATEAWSGEVGINGQFEHIDSRVFL